MMFYGEIDHMNHKKCKNTIVSFNGKFKVWTLL